MTFTIASSEAGRQATFWTGYAWTHNPSEAKRYIVSSNALRVAKTFDFPCDIVPQPWAREYAEARATVWECVIMATLTTSAQVSEARHEGGARDRVTSYTGGPYQTQTVIDGVAVGTLKGV